LKIFSDEAQWKAWGSKVPRGVLVPAGMAFGTGEHATTATCLRLLCDAQSGLPESFAAADLGTGTGILAVAMELLGASAVLALDNDPAAVRITKANAKKNRCRSITTRQGSVLDWKSDAPLDLITANLFSELLIEAAPVISRALKTRGLLIFSGVLQSQKADVAKALGNCGFEMLRVVDRGKWCAGLARLEKPRKRKM
jgi:ribosomal protein L11 methyltransferase